MQGLETEFGFSALDNNGKRCDEQALVAILEYVKRRVDVLPSTGNGYFIANGGLLYVDTGDHLEWATPECTSPREVVKFQRSGERLVAAAAAELEASGQFSRLQVFKSNVCYASRNISFGSHESCLYRNFSDEMARLLIPFLVSRVVFTGAGGLMSNASGIQFSLSPRAAHLDRESSHDTMRRRGIFNTRNESLSTPGYRRMHLICGDSNCSQFQTWLRLGSTMLVVAMIDAGVVPAGMVQLDNPVGALKRFATDTSCAASFADPKNPQGITALGIQYRYLALAQRHLDHALMPDWAEEICTAWRETLDCLSQEPLSMVDRLDWPLKLELMKRRVEQHCIGSMENVAVWNLAIEEVEQAMGGLERDEAFPVTYALIKRHRRKRIPLGDAIRNATARLAEKKFRWCQLDQFMDLRWQLCELDMAYGDLSPRGLFNALDNAGALNSRLWSERQCEAAITQSPAEGRARIRGDEIKRRSKQCSDDTGCTWTHIFQDYEQLDLSDPFATDAKWRDSAASRSEHARSRRGERLDVPAFLRRRAGD